MIIVPFFFAGLAISWFYRVNIFAFLLVPSGGALSPFDGQPVYTKPTGMMSATFGLAWKGGAVVAFPALIASILTLIRPLTGRYWGFILAFIAAVGLSFLGGVAFAYYVMLPAAMGFLLSFGDGIAVPIIDISEYLALFTSLVFWTGVIFTIPPIMFGLTKSGLASYSTFNSRTTHKLVFGFAMIFAAILTPTTDLMTYAFMFVPMFALYEVGVFASWLARPEEGNYLWLKTVAAALRRLRDALAWPYRRVRRVTEKQIVIVVTVLCVAVWVWLLAWLLWDDLLELRWEVTQWAYR